VKDIELAKKILSEENLAIAIVREGKCIYKSDRRGIYPLYMALINHKEELQNASSADRVIGRGAAQLYEYAKVKYVFANVISEGTKEVLEKSGIAYEAEKTVPYIKNREQNGMCPVETLSYQSKDIDELLKNMASFLKDLNLI
jgi:asparagine synthetase B (glutamine-hydrolysing)